MAKVTSKLQVTLPKALAEQYGIGPGDEIQWMAAGDVIRVIPPGKAPDTLDTQTRLRLFDKATVRQRKRDRKRRAAGLRQPAGRGWTRDELYGDRGRPC